MIMDFEAVERVQLGHSKEMNGWHQMLEKGIRRKSYRPLWITNATELLYTSKNSSECQRLIASMKKQQDGYSILPHAGKYGYKAVTICSDDIDIFCNVTQVSIQDKCYFTQTIWN